MVTANLVAKLGVRAITVNKMNEIDILQLFFIVQGGFCPFSKKKSRPPSKKLKPIFGKKLISMEATLGIKKKTQFFFDKYIQKLFKSSLDFQKICRIFQVLKEFL